MITEGDNVYFKYEITVKSLESKAVILDVTVKDIFT